MTTSWDRDMLYDHDSFGTGQAAWSPPWASACAEAASAPAMPRPLDLVEPAMLSKHPILALSKTGPAARTVRVSPTLLVSVESQIGAIATIYDYDILLYAVSQVFTRNMANLTARFRVADFLDVMQWDTSGSAYQRFHAALQRLQHTQVTFIETTGDRQNITVLPLVSALSTSSTARGPQAGTEVSLRVPEILAASVERAGGRVTLSRDYCRLRRPTDKALFRIARHDMTAGRIRHRKAASWTVSELMVRLGSPQRSGPFKRDLLKTVESWPLSGLSFSLEGRDRGRDTVLRARMT